MSEILEKEHHELSGRTRQLIAEAIGTFVLVFGGVGSAVFAGEYIGAVGVSFAFGLSLLAMVYVIGPISGCHVNPAVTFGLLLRKRIETKRALGYMAAQIVGAIVAAALIALIASGAGYDPSRGFGANGFGEHSPGGYNLGAAFLAEVILTFFLVITVLGATSTEAPVGFAGVAIGFALTLIHLVGIPITNTSVNPARSIGPALFAGGWALAQLWMFVLAPLAGAALAALADAALRVRPTIPVPRAEEALPTQQREREAHA